MKKAILLLNVGTPLSPKVSHVKKYLIEFLLDPRVITKNFLLREMLVRAFIVPFRKKKSAELYKAIWGTEGSPLLTHTIALKKALQLSLSDDYIVECAMRYQSPSIDMALQRLQNESLSQITIIPLFPQYASATTGSSVEAVMKTIASWRHFPPKITFINQFWNEKGYISAFVENAKKWPLHKYDAILFSFHGLPADQDKENPLFISYRKSCIETAHAIAKALKIDPSCYTVSFQSRLGKEKWLEPYTSTVIQTLAKKGAKKLLVVCPSFVADCLETIHEIGVEAKEEFCHAGGEELDLVECPNASQEWVEGLKNIIIKNT